MGFDLLVWTYVLPALVSLAALYSGRSFARISHARGWIFSLIAPAWLISIGIVLVVILFPLAPYGLLLITNVLGGTGNFLLAFGIESYFVGRNRRS